MIKPKILSDEELILKEIRTPTGESIGGWRVMHVETDIDIDATLQRQVDYCYKEMLGQIIKLLDDMFEQRAFTEYHILFDNFRQALQSQLEEG